MSSHTFCAASTKLGIEVSVTLGYDRPLDHFYCYIAPWGDDRGGDEVIYSSLFDEQRCDAQEIEAFIAPLAEHGIAIPQAVIDNARLDRVQQVVNKVYRYTAQVELETVHFL